MRIMQWLINSSGDFEDKIPGWARGLASRDNVKVASEGSLKSTAGAPALYSSNPITGATGHSQI